MRKRRAATTAARSFAHIVDLDCPKSVLFIPLLAW